VELKRGSAGRKNQVVRDLLRGGPVGTLSRGARCRYASSNNGVTPRAGIDAGPKKGDNARGCLGDLTLARPARPDCYLASSQPPSHAFQDKLRASSIAQKDERVLGSRRATRKEAIAGVFAAIKVFCNRSPRHDGRLAFAPAHKAFQHPDGTSRRDHEQRGSGVRPIMGAAILPHRPRPLRVPTYRPCASPGLASRKSVRERSSRASRRGVAPVSYGAIITEYGYEWRPT
jgi:hypothetical protein